MSSLRPLVSELARRRVFRVAAGYAVVAWLVIQIANNTFPALRLPDWALTFVIVCVLLGFPIAVVLAWAFEVTPDGVRRDRGPGATTAAAPARVPAYAGFGAAALVLIGVGAFVVLDRRAGGSAAEPAAYASIAVLPFSDLSAARDQEYVGHGISEELLNVLAQMGGLRVAARTSSFAFAGRDVPVTEIGRQLGVATVLEGSVRATAGQLRVTAQLIDARTGFHLWSHVYERELADVFAIQDEISAAIANALELRLVGVDGLARRGRARDPEAYLLYLRGRHAWNERTLEGLWQAKDQFERALHLDPTFALAHAGLADAYMLLDDFRALPRDEAFARGTVAARRALEIDETLAEAHTSIAHILMHKLEFEDSEREFRRALELNPNLATAHQWYSLLLLLMRRWDDAVEHARRAAELDPLALGPLRAPAVALYTARRPAEAITELAAALERLPDQESLHDWLAWAYLALGRHDEAAAIWQRMDYSSLPIAFAAGGRIEDARRELDALERRYGDRPPRPSMLAIAYAHLGELDRAFDWLDRAVHAQEPTLDFLPVSPEFDPLRADPRFESVLRKTGHLR